MLHFFLQKGHTLESFKKLNTEEKLIMQCSMEIAIEEQEQLAEAFGNVKR